MSPGAELITEWIEEKKMKLDLSKPLETVDGREVKLLSEKIDDSDYCIAFAWALAHDKFGGFMVGMCDASGNPLTRYEPEDFSIPVIRNKIELDSIRHGRFGCETLVDILQLPTSD